MNIPEKISKKDFIEIAFTARIKDGKIFDSNIKEDIEKEKLPLKPKPFVFCLGHEMFIKAVDEFLEGKEVGRLYTIEIEPEKAFGKRDVNLIKKVPLKIFTEMKQTPQPGMIFNFDGQFGKILSVSGGRVITDFNNPLAGKDIIYTIKVDRKVTDNKEKTKAILDFFFGQEFKFEIDEKGKEIIIEASAELKPLFELFKNKFKEMLGFDLKFKEIKEVEKSKGKEAEAKNNHNAI
ncbi:peptidylprolyl isomerase [Candidatus Pacearchaeota archaeon]|nr:peptidylprolyl isomerase [Candidatus Pacearchaeota archaeon]